jgi:hypothetical protein
VDGICPLPDEVVAKGLILVRSMSTPPPHDLDKSARQLLDEMEKLITGSQNPAFNTQLAMRALHKFAGVLAVVSLAADKHSKRLVVLTVALLVFTIALFAFTVFLYKDTHALVNHEQAAKPHPAEHP